MYTDALAVALLIQYEQYVPGLSTEVHRWPAEIKGGLQLRSFLRPVPGNKHN